MLAFYTYCDTNYTVRAAAMYESLRRYIPKMTFFVLCLDTAAYEYFLKRGFRDAVLLTLADVESADAELCRVKQSRSIVEYFFTLTSCAGKYIAQRYSGFHILTYLDADLYFFSDVQPLFEELADRSIGVTLHRPKVDTAVRQGRYNVGWVSWRLNESGLACLADYRRQCLEWCYLREEDGKYADQYYLDTWETRPGFHAFRHPGANVAPWNLADYRISCEQGVLCVDKAPLIFFHFHKFAALSDSWFDANLWYTRKVDRVLKAKLIIPYIEALRSCAVGLPLTGSLLKHFPYRSPVGRLTRNTARVLLGIARSSYVYHPRAGGRSAPVRQ